MDGQIITHLVSMAMGGGLTSVLMIRSQKKRTDTETKKIEIDSAKILLEEHRIFEEKLKKYTCFNTSCNTRMQ